MIFRNSDSWSHLESILLKLRMDWLFFFSFKNCFLSFSTKKYFFIYVRKHRKMIWKIHFHNSRGNVFVYIAFAKMWTTTIELCFVTLVDPVTTVNIPFLNEVSKRFTPANIRLDEDVLKTSWRHLSSSFSEDVLKASSRRLDQD